MKIIELKENEALNVVEVTYHSEIDAFPKLRKIDDKENAKNITEESRIKTIIFTDGNILNETTGDIIESTSHMLRDQGAEIQKSSAEAMISPEILQNSFNEAIMAIEEVSAYKEQALPRMKETIQMFSDMADEGQKVVNKIETGNKDLIE